MPVQRRSATDAERLKREGRVAEERINDQIIKEKIMKIAVPVRGNVIDDHFGHCEAYAIYTISDDRRVENVETLPSPQGCGCKSNIATVFEEMGVKIMLAGNMGNGALNVLNSHGVEVFRGCSGEADMVVASYLAGEIRDSGDACAHHDCH